MAVIILLIFTGEKVYRRLKRPARRAGKSYVVKMEKHTYKQADKLLDIPMPVKVRGAFAEPQIKIDFKTWKKAVGKVLKAETKAEVKQKVDQKKDELKDKLKNKFKGLFK